MSVFIALLRGVNVAGKNVIKMSDLARAAEELGPERVETYLQSGNLVLRAGGSAKTWASRLESMLAGKFGASAAVIVRTADEMQKAIADNPFLSEKTADETKLHLFFAASLPAKAGLAKLNRLALGWDQFALLGRHVYLQCPKGYGRTKLSNAFLEKKLSVTGTTRNWNTVKSLAAMAREL